MKRKLKGSWGVKRKCPLPKEGEQKEKKVKVREFLTKDREGETCILCDSAVCVRLQEARPSLHWLGPRVCHQFYWWLRLILACRKLLNSGGRRVLPDLHLAKLHLISPSYPPRLHSSESLKLNMILLSFVHLKKFFGLTKIFVKAMFSIILLF